MNVLSMMGEAAWRMASDVAKSNDGSFIGVQTAKGAFSCGERVDGYVVLQNNSPRQVDRVLVRITCKERTHWDEEISRTVSEGEGDNRKTYTVYEHHERRGKVTHEKVILVASAIPHLLAPGNYSYPFAYTLRPDLPGCAQFTREREANDPAWRSAGRRIRTHGEVTYKIKAYVDFNGLFSRDLFSKQALTVNSAFDWQHMKPAFGEKSGQVLLLCCIPRGNVRLQAAFDRAAYAAGETAQIKASIKNDAEQNISAMKVKLMRFITLRSNQGQQHSIVDTVCQATYPGVERMSEATRDLPLPLFSPGGAIMPGTKARLVDISYRFDVECGLTCAPDIEVS